MNNKLNDTNAEIVAWEFELAHSYNTVAEIYSDWYLCITKEKPDPTRANVRNVRPLIYKD
jgi:hypothetical protein